MLYGEAVHRMIAAMADIRARHGVILHELNLGGGHGVPYVSGDPELDLAELSDVITTRWTGRALLNGSRGRASWSNRDAPSAPAPG